MVVLYDPNGNIVHTHESVNVQGGTHPSRDVIERDALEQAANAGRDTTNLSILHVDPNSLKTDANYKVDTIKGVLVEVPHSTHSKRKHA